MVESGPQIKQAWVIIPVLLLLIAGITITVQSGIARSASGFDVRQFSQTLARMMVRIVGYVLALLVLQYFIGQRPSLGW